MLLSFVFCAVIDILLVLNLLEVRERILYSVLNIPNRFVVRNLLQLVHAISNGVEP